ncbi:hypothetical protein [Microcella sp.]|uniref:hypothetical protein n=1 Tax=Microcella sp. TaxID=1913979 RepID=UPI002564F72D|nr:hypothetical protein [Microcella sp.]MBX9472247.1 hypothetical protein [Microcella sp.]
MWIKHSGVIGTVALPTESPSRVALGPVEAWIRSLHDDEARVLDDQLEAAVERFATEFDQRALGYTAAEDAFAAVPLPVSVVQSIDVAELRTDGLAAEVEKVDFRWRLDLIAALQQMLAER